MSEEDAIPEPQELLPLLIQIDFEDPYQFAIPALRSFPSPDEKAKGQRVAIPVQVNLKEWSKELWDMGYRMHTDKMTLYPIPGDQPGMGFLNAERWVNREEYVKYLAKNKLDQKNSLESLLRAIAPDKAGQIDKMTEKQKKAALIQAQPAAMEALAQLQELNDALNKVLTEELGDEDQD